MSMRHQESRHENRVLLRNDHQLGLMVPEPPDVSCGGPTFPGEGLITRSVMATLGRFVAHFGEEAVHDAEVFFGFAGRHDERWADADDLAG